MKMTRRNFLSTSAVAAFACGASLTAHAAGSTDENSLNFITDIFKDSTQPGEIEDATAITAEKNAEWYEKLDFSDRREFANAERGWLDNADELRAFIRKNNKIWSSGIRSKKKFQNLGCSGVMKKKIIFMLEYRLMLWLALTK